MQNEAKFEPPDLEPNLPLLEAHFASNLASTPTPIRNYHIEPAVSAQVRRTATPSAVLIPIILDPDPRAPMRVLLTRRHPDISYPGQICFPGGRADPDDRDPRATALREAHEEIDLDPNGVQILGTLGDYYTHSGYRITPVVGVIRSPLELTASPAEVVEILEIPFAVLTRAQSYRLWRTDLVRSDAFYAMEHGDVRLTGPTVCLAMGFYEALAQTEQTLRIDGGRAS